MLNEYRFSGSLPEDASTYVTREADTELYESLTAGKFCYVLNSRQSGKSSIRVRTMRRLRDAGVECAAIDLSAGGVQNVTPEQWYVDLIDDLIESFALDVDLGNWWGKNQLHSEVTRFRKFIEEVLLVDVKENIVIFIDEIDSVLSLKFPTDDFFALIRAFHNQRVDNSDYNRLTFCLLGVASPSNLIQDKQRTPFNIGRGIHLKGFQLHEVEPLRKGLEGKFAEPQAVMEEILNWTGGQPFLTQKLCQFMVEESEKDNPGSVEEVARARIIENWELQDEPEHLRTIRSRILRDEERAGYLLDLYRQIRSHEEVLNNDSAEQSELLLSGLVGKQQDKLRVYNQIYQEVFNQSWVEAELKKLRPYSEAFRAWVASGFVDESRLLRGNALKDAEEWGRDKNLSYQDKQFLAASKEKEIQEEIAAKEKEAQLERERKDREATEQRNKALTAANRKARQRIRVGSFILIFTLLLTGILGIQANLIGKKVAKNNEYLTTVEKLAKLAGQLREEGSDIEAKELFSQASQSVNIPNYNTKQQVLYAGIAYANLKLRENNLNRDKNSATAANNLQEAESYLSKMNLTDDDSSEGLQVKILRLRTQGSLYKQKKDNQKAIDSYQKAFDIFKNLKERFQGKEKKEISPPFNPNIKIKLLSQENVEALHREFLELLQNKKDENNPTVFESLKQHFYDELENSLFNKKWQQANTRTSQLMLYLAKREKEQYLDIPDINTFYCNDLQKIDQKWLKASDNIFGLSLQKDIWIEEIKKEGLDLKTLDYNKIDQDKDKDKSDRLLRAYQHFATRVGWYDKKKKEYIRTEETIVSYDAPEATKNLGYTGHLPRMGTDWYTTDVSRILTLWNYIFSLLSRCDL
jgi:hypothetical protein